MAATLEKVTADALTLSPRERGQLAALLWDSLPGEDDAPLSEEWMAEIKRRIQSVDEGAQTFSAEEVLEELKQKYP